MAKNIILCADGTGNEGGSTPDSNVYKLYKSVDKIFKGTSQEGVEISEQIVFYENGVGTEQNKYFRMLAGGLGFGFADNVRDLYTFLARNYESGDRVYFFGFSRGASTVRACNGFITTCGLLKGKGLRKSALDKQVKETFAAYKKYPKKSDMAEQCLKSEHSHGVIDIHFIGVWDTVVALGFPKRTDIIGPVSLLLTGLAIFSEKVLNTIWPHDFYTYTLSDNVKHAYQALAIDDERTGFWPYVWKEKGREKGSIEQVWFAGMHSNVGGGYPRSGLSNVALYWMMLRARQQGIQFEDNSVKNILNECHVHGRMYNSRSDFSAIYRYHPREIEKLCGKRIEGPIKIHRSVIERLNHRTANYAAGQLPDTFEIVDTDMEALPEVRNPSKQAGWHEIKKEIKQLVFKRKVLYEVMLTFMLMMIVSTVSLYGFQALPENSASLWGELVNYFDFLLPNFLDGLINYTVLENPMLSIGATVFLGAFIGVRMYFSKKISAACEELRHLVIIDDPQNKS